MSEEKIKPKERPFYVSNKKLYEVYTEHYADIAKAEAEGKPIPQMPRFIAEAIIKISAKYANKPNFIGYSYRDEMIADAREICVKNYRKFDLTKSENPFAYLTQFCQNAFLQRIAKEKKQTSVKARYIANAIDADFITQQSHEDEEFHNTFVEFLRENSTFEDTIAIQKEKKRKLKESEAESTLEDFMEGDEDE